MILITSLLMAVLVLISLTITGFMGYGLYDNINEWLSIMVMGGIGLGVTNMLNVAVFYAHTYYLNKGKEQAK